MQNIEEFFKTEKVNKNIIPTIWKKIIRQVQEEIKDNRKTLEMVNNVDKKYYKKNINIEELLDIVKSYENISIEPCEQKQIIYSYYGNPLLTLNLLMQSLQYNVRAIFAIEDFMLGVNTILITIINKVLEENRIKNMFHLENLVDVQVIKKVSKNINKVICIGNSFNYFLYKKRKIENTEYYPLNTIDIFCDSEELEDLEEKIYQYCQEEFIEIEVYDCENIDEAINLFNHSISAYGVLLTTSKDTIKKAKDKINKLKMFINKNPFENQTLKIADKYLK